MALRVLVLGDRFVGGAVARRLVVEGHAVGAPSELMADAAEGPGRASDPGATDPAHGARALSGEAEIDRFRPAVVVHTNLTTLEAAEAFVERWVGVAERVVVLSSADVYRAYGRLMRQEPGRLEPVPLAETAPLRRSFFVYRRMAGDPAEPLFHYEKLLVETALAREPSLANTIIRPASVYGPGDPDRQLFALVKRMMDERPAILVGERAAAWRWSWVYVDNLAAAVALAVASPEAVGGVYNVADEPTPTQHEWIEAVAAAAAWPGDVRVLPDAGLPRHLLPPVDVRQDLVLDTGRIRRELGFQESVKREKALAETVEWTRAHPPDRFDPRRFDYAAEDQVLSRLGGAVE